MSLRIVVDPTGYHFLNIGDVAMHQVAVRRLRELWPDATIQVISDDVDLLARYCPGTVFVPAEGQRSWFYGSLARRAGKRLPGRVRRGFARVEEDARVRVSRPLLTATRTARRVRGAENDAIDHYLAALEGADLLVVSGGGLVTDAFSPYALVVLRELELAVRRRRPTFMFGQGIGPISDPELRSAAARVLPRVDLIGVREARTGPSLLAGLGVDPGRVSITGDDALELTQGAPRTRGEMLGINVRVAGYAPLSKVEADRIVQGVAAASREHGADLLAVPISRHPGESDLESVRRLFPGVEGSDAETAEDVIAAAGRCRVVATGSYHTGVFALGQGIPCVCLVTSPFYRDKFLGLATQFPGGCWIVDVADADAAERLRTSIRAAWRCSDETSDDLRAAAGRQVAASRAAYSRAGELVRGRTP